MALKSVSWSMCFVELTTVDVLCSQTVVHVVLQDGLSYRHLLHQLEIQVPELST